jgi:hypothetical protein
MHNSGQAVLVQERLYALLLQVEGASVAHAFLQNVRAEEEREVILILTQLQELAQLPDGETSVNGASRCDHLMRIDSVLRDVDRLLHADRALALACVNGQFCNVSPANQFHIFGNLALVEAYVATAKALAYQILSALSLRQVAN